MAVPGDQNKGDQAKAGDKSAPVRIKKYANRRLYNTATSSYVTLDYLAQMVREGLDFTVEDAKTGEDITRSVLTQIIVEEESKGQNMLPINFLRQLISLYGDNLQFLVPALSRKEHGKLRRQPGADPLLHEGQLRQRPAARAAARRCRSRTWPSSSKAMSMWNRSRSARPAGAARHAGAPEPRGRCCRTPRGRATRPQRSQIPDAGVAASARTTDQGGSRPRSQTRSDPQADCDPSCARRSTEPISSSRSPDKIDKPALILNHSLATSHEMWGLQLPVFARHFRVVAFDMRGHGASAAPAHGLYPRAAGR